MGQRKVAKYWGIVVTRNARVLRTILKIGLGCLVGFALAISGLFANLAPAQLVSLPKTPQAKASQFEISPATSPSVASPAQTPSAELSRAAHTLVTLDGAESSSSGTKQPNPESSSTIKAAEENANGSENNGGLRPFDQVVGGLEPLAGMLTLYRDRDKGKLYLALTPQQLNRNFLLVTTLESGIGEAGLFNGWPISDQVIQFRRAPANRLQVVVPNFNFRGEGQQRQIENSYSDSILYGLPIVSIKADDTVLIDFSSLLLSNDLADLTGRLGWALGGYIPDSTTSYMSEVKAFPQNLEVEANIGFSGLSDGGVGGFPFGFGSLPDSRGFSISVHYSLSELPTDNGYRPRLADERIGYFVTAYQEPLAYERRDPFVRYVQRWHLERQPSNAELAPPKEPIVFWLENTVPERYRDAIREGALWWNTAFEQAGFANAIEVRQMPDDADWDPADVRYNTIRWSNSYRPWAVALGPSRVNPLTGEILDADVIIDANIIRQLRGEYQNLAGNGSDNTYLYSQLCGHRFQAHIERWLAMQQGMDLAEVMQQGFELPGLSLADHDVTHNTCFGVESSRQLAFGGLMLSTLRLDPANPTAVNAYIQQYLSMLTAHEVGHTLGLRHNFQGSLLRSPDELNDPSLTQTEGIANSVMDYFPANLAPPGAPQADYFPNQVGAYDRLAVEYGYTDTGAMHPNQEVRTLEAIAQRMSIEGLAYATDEDIFSFLDPEAQAFDLSSDPMQFAQWQMDNAREHWQRLDGAYLLPEQGYEELRDRFETVYWYYANQVFTLSGYVGGQNFSRQRAGDSAISGRLPFEPVPIEQQRQALALLNTYVFAPDAFQFSPTLINQLAPERWYHWGSLPIIAPLEYPIYDRVSFLQGLALIDVLSGARLSRLQSVAIGDAASETLSIPELFDTVQRDVWQELADSDTGNVSTLRRGLQRHYLDILTGLVLQNPSQPTNFLELVIAFETLYAPEDAKVIARYKLRQLAQDIQTSLDRHGDRLDVSTRAHLEDSRDRIQQTLSARRTAG
ncbi:MAG: zinc-dependent metalloprotease [Cyanobacteria bacterium J06642_9]